MEPVTDSLHLDYVPNQEPLWGAVDRFRQGVNGRLVTLDTDIASAGTTAVAASTSYTPTRSSDWAGDAPTTVQEAVDRIAYHVQSGAGAAAIVALP